MRPFLKNTQTLIGSLIFIILTIITLILPEYQAPVLAITDPISVPNNKFGIHIISATPTESSPAATLVNTNGDWGYLTVLIETKDRDLGKWQEFFNDLRRRHLIPLVRIATKPVGEYWEKPSEDEIKHWAEFLNKLNWPTKNRYVIIFNEPNHGKEWGNLTDPASYAVTLNAAIEALKAQSPDFFVLNAGFDASSPHQPPLFYDEAIYLTEMNQAVPGIFNKLDGWVSHSYPNPGFVGSPQDTGRGSVRTYLWEIEFLKNLGLNKDLPIFITETGWQHSDGLNFQPAFPSPDIVADYYQNAFEVAWNHPKIVAVTPFLLSYQDKPFDHFSFKKINSTEYHPHYSILLNMSKTKGEPVQENRSQITKGEIYTSLVRGQTYDIPITLKNTGQSIWEKGQVELRFSEGGKELGIENVRMPAHIMVEPQGEYTFMVHLKTPESGKFKVVFNLFNKNKQFDSSPYSFTTEVKSPVVLKIKSTLLWQDNFAGEYLLKIASTVGDTLDNVTLNEAGTSEELQALYLLPGYSFDFTLSRPFYQPKTITQRVQSGVNEIDFGTLEPDLVTLTLNPTQIKNIIPFSDEVIKYLLFADPVTKLLQV